jgi:hypothetical protein
VKDLSENGRNASTAEGGTSHIRKKKAIFFAIPNSALCGHQAFCCVFVGVHIATVWSVD